MSEIDLRNKELGWPLEDAVDRVLAELRRRGSAIERVRELHADSGEGYCTTCGPKYHTICCDEPAWPCPTIEALEDELR